MILSIVALCVFVFGAYAYGSVVVLSLRHRAPVWSSPAPPEALHLDSRLVGLAMFITCTVWFVLHTIIEFRFLMGEPRENDLIDLAALELAFLFPGLIFHTVLLETGTDAAGRPPAMGRGWATLLAGLYLAGLAMAVYFPLAIFRLVPAPPLNGAIGVSIATLFIVTSLGCIAVMLSRPQRTATRDQRQLRRAMLGLFIGMTVLFAVLSFMREQQLILQVLYITTRATPLAFLLVSVYFESRIEFYDLVIKRGVILLLSLLILAGVLGPAIAWLDPIRGGATRAWLFALVLLPIATLMPWLHDRVGRLLDRLWFGREFTPVEAVKHVLGAMQQATDEPSLVRATEATLSDMFRQKVVIVLDDQPPPVQATLAASITPAESAAAVRFFVVNDPTVRPMLSEDHALLRSLGGVFGFMLENVRMQRRRQEQEQMAHELRLQTSRSELKALRAQINPHFLFNALNAIASLIHTDPVRADTAVEQLAEVFRYTLRRSDQEWAPLDQELAFARAYLDVEQARFGRRLTFGIEADAAASRALVPSMLLQTLVENAVKHGISRVRTPGRIDVRAARAGGRLVLEVRDTGPGLDEAAPRHSTGESFGLRSVRDRLQGHFGESASLSLAREGDATVARIELPFVDQPTSVAGIAR